MCALLLATSSAAAGSEHYREDADKRTAAASPKILQQDPAALIATGRFAEALPLLERQVMLHSDDVDAWIEFARANNEVGRADDAAQILGFIERELAPDQSARQRIAVLRHVPITASLQPLHRWRADVSFLSGYESNANAGPSVRQVTFNLSGESIVLDLAEKSLPQPSTSNLVETRLESNHALGERATLSTILNWRERGTPDFPAAASRQRQAEATLAIAGDRSAAPSNHQWLVSVAALDLDYGGDSLFRSQRLALGGDYRFNMVQDSLCRLQGTVEHEWRRYPSQDGLSSSFDAIQGAAVCVSGRSRWLLVSRFGEDHPDTARPGGLQRRQELSLGYRYDIPAAGQVDVQAAYAISRDAEIYNEVLGERKRRLARSQLSMSYLSQPFFGNWQAIARAEIFHQRSNIGLFRLRGKSAHLGLRYTF